MIYNPAGAARSIDLNAGTYFDLFLDQNCALTLPSGLLTTKVYSFTLLARQDATGGRSLILPAATKYTNDTAPVQTVTPNKSDMWFFLTVDGGASWIADIAIPNLSLAAGAPPADTTPPAVPTGLTATATDGGFTLNWADNTDADLHATQPYDYRYSTSNPPTDGTPVTRATSDASVTGLTNGTQHHAQVRARDASGNVSAWSSVVSVTPTGGASYLTPSLVTGQKASVGTANVATVTATLPAAVTAGRVLLAAIRYGGAGISLNTIEAGAGKPLTLLGTVVADGSTVLLAIYARVVQAGDSNAVTVTVSGGSSNFLGCDLSEWNNLTAVMDAQNGGTSGGVAASTINTGSLTPTITHTVLIASGSAATGGTAPNWSIDGTTPGWDIVLSAAATSRRLYTVAKVLTAIPGSADSAKFNIDQSLRLVAKIMAVKAATA